MKLVSLLFFVVLAGCFTVSGPSDLYGQERKPQKVKRVKRPQFSPQDWDGIYFENLFAEGLVGDRPDQLAANNELNKPSEMSNQTGSDMPTTDQDFAWSRFVSGTTIEDEVKTIQLELAKVITSPVKFKSDYDKVHHHFSMLSMLFGIIREYDSDVRWKKYAGPAQASFERAAANSRVGTIQAFESCKRRKEEIQELVRGGNFVGEDKAPDLLDWGTVVDRTPIMERLQISYDQMKKATSNESDFKDNIEIILHESELVAAMSETLLRENFVDADDEGYAEFAKAMSFAAVNLTKSCKTKNYDMAANSVNQIGQSCSNCHSEWR
ncbi:MAG: hypothetical protein AAF623_19380 [Planctomycetota bacterium]